LKLNKSLYGLKAGFNWFEKLRKGLITRHPKSSR
jgi:hypothetical protein